MSRLPRLPWLSFACGLVSACSLINPPAAERRPQPNPCDAGSCSEDDACARCDPLARCEPGDGGARCSCPADHRDVNGDGSECAAPASCAATRCGPNQRCSLDAGVASCSCRTGYEPADAGCVDVDECEGALHDCDPLARCSNRAGGFVCVCPAGFDDREGDGRRCADIDECASSEPVCGEHATCENRSGSFECRCEAGYDGNPRAGCEDTEECAQGRLTCRLPALCRSAPGPDACACPAYYNDVNGDGSVCRDDRSFASVTSHVTGLALAARPIAGGPGPVLVAAGGFEGTQVGLCGHTFNSAGARDLIVAFYDAELRCQFARPLGSAGDDDLRYMQVAPDGGPLLLVELHGAFELDGATVGIDGSSCALIQLDADGRFRWSFELPGCSERAPDAHAWIPVAADRIALDADGNAYVVWTFPPGSTAFGPLSLPPSEGTGVLMAKLSNQGIPLWIETLLPDPADPTAQLYDGAVSVDPTGHAYFVAHAYGRFQQPGGPTREGPSSIVLALAADGMTTRWIQTFPNEPQAVFDVAAHEDGLSLLRAEPVAGGRRVTWQRLELAGNERFRVLVGEGEIIPAALEADATGQVSVVGQVYMPGSVAGEAATAANSFLAKFDREGLGLWSHLYDQELIALEDLAVAPSGAIYLYGSSPATGHTLLALRP